MRGAGVPIVDGWYSLIPGVLPAERGLSELPVVRSLPRRLRSFLTSRSISRGVLLFAASIRRPAVGIAKEDPGWGTLLLLRALLGRRPKLLAFVLILHPRRHPLRRLLVAFDRWALRRALLRGHALTRSDLDLLTSHYDLPETRFAYIPWPLAMDPPARLPPAPPEQMVLSAGRAYCDWETLFAAARGSGWPLTVVCDERDRRRVEALNEGVGAAVHSELPRDEFWALLDRASVSVVAMQDRGTSQGHIRIMDASAHGAPLVITATGSLDGYVQDGETALVVAPGDPHALRAAVDRLLASPADRARLREAAFARALRWQVPHYFEALTDFAHGRPVRLPAAAPGA